MTLIETILIVTYATCVAGADVSFDKYSAEQLTRWQKALLATFWPAVIAMLLIRFLLKDADK